MTIKASFNGVPLKRLTGICAFGDLTYDRACVLELAFPASSTAIAVDPRSNSLAPLKLRS